MYELKIHKQCQYTIAKYVSSMVLVLDGNSEHGARA